MSQNKRKRQRSKKEWTILINKFYDSSITRKEFCQQNNLSLEYFYRLEHDFFKEKNSFARLPCVGEGKSSNFFL